MLSYKCYVLYKTWCILDLTVTENDLIYLLFIQAFDTARKPAIFLAYLQKSSGCNIEKMSQVLAASKFFVIISAYPKFGLNFDIL